MTALSLGEIVIVGGGCYGTFYARQLAEARSRAKLEYREVLVVDRNPVCQLATELDPDPTRLLVVEEWDHFFDRYLGDQAVPNRSGDSVEAPSVIVPSPLMPHLMYEWLVRRARARWPGRLVESRPVPDGPRTPYDVASPDLVRYVSFADWPCPTHCTEPARCPVIRAPRTWEMGEAIARLAERLRLPAPILFECRHQVFAVGSFSVAQVLGGDRRVGEAGDRGGEVNLLVGTVSACHGALNLLHLGPA